MLLPGIADRSEFTLDYSLLLAGVNLYVPLWKKHDFGHMWLVLMVLYSLTLENFACVTFFNPRSNCLWL